MKLNMNDASDIFGNAVSIQPQILTINGKKVNNSKDEKLEISRQKENNFYKKEKSQIKEEFEDFNSYEHLLCRILDDPLINNEKGNNESIQKKKNKKVNDDKYNNNNKNENNQKKYDKKSDNKKKNLLEKKKTKGNSKIQNYFENKLNRIKTRDFEIKKYENKILDNNKSSEKEKVIINTHRKLKEKKNNKEEYNIPELNVIPIKNDNNKFYSNIDFSLNKDEKSFKSEIQLSKSIHKSEKFSIDSELLSNQSKKKFEENKNCENVNFTKKKITNKPVYVLTNQIVNINKKRIINNLEQNDNYSNSKISTSTKKSEKKKFKEEFIQTEDYILKKNHITFSVKGKKKSWFCCF